MPNAGEQNVLIITYYWPPAGGPGVQRWLQFVKYLPTSGITPIVFVPENPSYPMVDDSLAGHIPEDVEVIKTNIREPYSMASSLSRKQTKTISSGILPKEGKQSLLQKAMLYIRGNYFIPDARVGWIGPSVRYLVPYLKENNISTIITTGPPHSLHLIGKALKKEITHLNWIADFRDPWTTIGYHDKLRMTKKTKAKHKTLEREVLQEATHIIVTSPSTKAEFQEITNRPITVITNGFDRQIRDSSSPKKVSSANDSIELRDKFTISHIGSLLSDRNPQILWEALSELTLEHSAFAKALQIQLVGKVSEDVIASIECSGLSLHLNLVGYVSHNNVVEFQNTADILLLIEIDKEITKAIIPGKVFEYLAARKPIIALGPKNADVTRIIQETHTGTYFNYNQKQELKREILERFHQQQEEPIGNLEEIKKYHRSELTKDLATLIKDINEWA